MSDLEEPEEEDKDRTQVTVAIGIILCLILGLGGSSPVSDGSRCEPVLPRSQPQFLPISLPDSVSATFPLYRLLAYSEGSHTNLERLKSAKFSGVPVLFIPDHGGSFTQAVSLAASAAQLGREREAGGRPGLDYFSLDLNSGWSGLSGSVLTSQLNFATEAVRRILELYKRPPDSAGSVVVVGHGVGADLAKMLVNQLAAPTSVQVILSLRAHTSPLASLITDKRKEEFYQELARVWTEPRSSKVRHVSLVSLSEDQHDLSASLRATVGRGVGGLWCRAMMDQINVALLTLVSPVTKQISLDPQLRTEVLQYNLVQGVGAGKPPSLADPDSVIALDKSGYWSDILKRQFSVYKGNVTCDHYTSIRVSSEDSRPRRLFLQSYNLSPNWLSGCLETAVHKNTRVCSQAQSLGRRSLTLPGQGDRRKVANIDLTEMWEELGFSHILVHTPADSPPSLVNIDMYEPAAREVEYVVPSWVVGLLPHTVLPATSPGTVYHRLSLLGLDSAWQVYSVTLQTLSCQPDQHQQIPGQIVSEGNDFILLNSSAEWEYFVARENHATIEFFLSPHCQYSISVRLSLGHAIEALARLCLPTLLPSHLIVVLLLLTSESFSACPHSSPLAVLLSLSPVAWLVVSRLTAYSLSLLQLSSDLDSLQPSNFGLLPLLAFFLGSGPASLLTGSVWGLVRLAALCLDTMQDQEQTGAAGAAGASGSVTKFVPLVCLLLAVVSLLSCGCLALLAGSLLYILHCARLLQTQLRQPTDLGLRRAVNINLALCLLWISLTALNIPSLIVWIKEDSLATDSSLVHSLCLLGSASILWQPSPRLLLLESRQANLVRFLTALLSVLVSVFATLSLYRASFVVSALFVVVASLGLLNMDWTSPDQTSHSQPAETTVQPGKKRGTLRIIRSYLETGEGEEGWDWELCLTEEGDTAILQYPYYLCVANRLATLPSQLINDLREVASIAFGFLCLTLENIWAQPRNPSIEVTVATPDFEYLPDNHPLRKLHLHTSNVDGTQVSKLEGFLENIKKMLGGIFQFHYTFYYDLFLVGKIGFGFLLYLLISCPVLLLKRLAGQSGGEQSTNQRFPPLTIVSDAFKGIVTMISKAVDDIGAWVLNYTQTKAESKQASKSPSPSTSTKQSAKVQKPAKIEDPQIRLPPRKAAEMVKKEASAPQKDKSSVTKQPTPAKSMEAFKQEVKIQEEILKIGKDKAKELFSGPAVVTGPWIAEKIVPGYREDRQADTLIEKTDSEEPMENFSKFRENRKETKPLVKDFDATIPASSVFERNSSKSGFEIKSKIKVPGWENTKDAVRGNIHGSMYDIHAACEDEAEEVDEDVMVEEVEVDDENIEELEKLREISPEPQVAKFYRRTDIVHVSGETEPSTRYSSLLSEAPPESPDIKTRYSVKDEIAQLRQSVREELISVRATEVDEAIASGISGESGVEEEYERIMVMKFDNKEGGERQRSRSDSSRRKSVNKKMVHHSPPTTAKLESSDEESPSWEIVNKDEVDPDDSAMNPLKRQLSVSSSGSFTHRSASSREPVSAGSFRRRNRSSTREEKGTTKHRSSSLQTDNRARSSDFCEKLSNRLSGEFGKSTHNVQVKRRDSFLDISIPFDDSKSDASMESLMFFSKTISDTANTFQNTLNETAEKFSKTLDKTAATLKKAISDKNLAHASTQELTETLHETAEILSKTSEILSETAKSSLTPSKLIETSHVKNPEPVKLMVNTPPENSKQETRSKPGPDSFPFRLDTITSQSEVDPSDSEVDTDDILRHIPIHQPRSTAKVPDYERQEDTRTPFDSTRPSSVSSDLSFKTPFGKTVNTSITSSAKDLFKEIAQSRLADDTQYENPVTGLRYRTPSRSGRGRDREESRSPERFNTSGLRSRGRDTVRTGGGLGSGLGEGQGLGAGQGPVVRTQSAASVRTSVQRQHDRSSSLAPPAPPQQRPSSSLASSSESLYRSPSYRLLGGKLVDTMLTTRDSSWRDETAGSGAAGDQIQNILREPYLIKTKDGRKQTLAEYEKSLVEDYKRRSQLNLSS